MNVVAVTDENRYACEAYVRGRPDTTFVDGWPWHQVVQRAYGIAQFWYMALDGDDVRGFLALSLSRNRLFGTYLTTAPFANQGGFYADGPEAADALLAQAIELHAEVGAKYTLVRRLSEDTAAPDGWLSDPSYATFYLPLNPDPERFYAEHLRSIVRNRIKKARKHRMTVRFGHTELVEDFWPVINRAVRDLGSPYHSRQYLDAVMAEHGTDAQLAVLYTEGGKPIGGSLLMHNPNAVSQLHVVCIKEYWSAYANDLLYWSVIEECCKRGLATFDMGRSLIGTGNERFKMKWRPERRPIDNWYYVGAGQKLPSLNQNNPKYDHARALWKHFPLPLAKLVGPRVMSGIL